MKGLFPLFLGSSAPSCSRGSLTVVPNAQIGHLDPQTDEEGADAYPCRNQAWSSAAGRSTRRTAVFIATAVGRPNYAGADLDRKWGERRSAPRDYIFERPVLLGKMRTGPDLSNIGQRAPLKKRMPHRGSASPGAAASPGSDGERAG